MLKEVSPEYSLEGLMPNLKLNTLATWWEKLTHWKRPWFWERLKAGGEGDNTGWDGWMASPTQWTWVWASSGRWWRTGKPGMLQFMGSQSVTHNWATEQQSLKIVLIFISAFTAMFPIFCFCLFWNASHYSLNWFQYYPLSHRLTHTNTGETKTNLNHKCPDFKIKATF